MKKACKKIGAFIRPVTVISLSHQTTSPWETPLYSVTCINLWNALPTSTKKCKSLDSFKTTLKEDLRAAETGTVKKKEISIPVYGHAVFYSIYSNMFTLADVKGVVFYRLLTPQMRLFVSPWETTDGHQVTSFRNTTKTKEYLFYEVQVSMR